LITGGAGFIGSHLVDEALRRGCDVVVLDNLTTGRLENLEHCFKEINFVQGDIRDRDLVFKLARGADRVFHHAAVTAVPETVDDPFTSAEVNDLGCLNVFSAARSAGVGRVVYASSSAVYGDTETLPHRESMIPSPNSPYAAHKLLGEHYAAIFRDLYDLEIVPLRYFNVFGPRQDPGSTYSGVISIFMDRLFKGRQPVVYGDGGQRRDFIYVQDVVEANFLAAETPGLAGRAINVGTGRAAGILNLLEIMSRLTGVEAAPSFEAHRPGDIYESRADVSRARELLGFSARTPLETGLARTLDWFRKGLSS